MKRLFLLAACLCAAAQARTATPEWQDPAKVAVGKEKPRSYLMSYPDEQSALTGDFSKSERFIGLNGQWSFRYLDDHKQVPADFYKPSYDVSGWDKITVPGNWERQGYGTAIYTNQPYEFCPSNPCPPQLPDVIPTGLYRTEFTLPADWADREVFLDLNGIKSGTYVYLNGQKVGYTEDSKTNAQFRLNDYMKAGKNVLALEVLRWTTGSYLECQDFWRISGIERDVYVWSQPRTHIQDYKVISTLGNDYRDGVFVLETILANAGAKASGATEVQYTLKDDAGKTVASGEAAALAAGARDTVRFEATLPDVHKWSAEDPYLYTLVMKIGHGNDFTEYTAAKVGFRTSEVRGNHYLVNGKKIFVKGVNYHEHDPLTGHYLSEATIRQDMQLMKQANINAIRTCHYPQSRRFYELADEYGFYVCSEANVETHGMGYDISRGHSLANNPEWLTAHMERTENMYEQVKNYPSVMFWSLGNEAGNGYNFYQTYLYMKSRDTLRPVQYERAALEFNTDIYCPMYPNAKQLKKWASEKTDRPYIFCEYAHAMGNSSGDFRDMWEVMYGSDNLQGGFIWDWVDQGFLEKAADGSEYWAYGGDYGKEEPSDGNFLCNGLVNPDRLPKPALMSEVKKVHQYVQFTPSDLAAGKVSIKNIYDFTSLDKYDIRWNITANGRKVREGKFVLNLAPGALETVTIPVTGLKAEAGVEYYLGFEVALKAQDGLLDKGYVVASDQFPLPVNAPKKPYKASGSVRIDETPDAIAISGPAFSLKIDRTTGYISSYVANGVEMVEDGFGLQPVFRRAGTDNDYGTGFSGRTNAWRDPISKAQSITVNDSDKTCALITAAYALPEATTLTVSYKVYPSGAVHVSCAFKGNPASKADLMRLGMRMRLPEAYEAIEYFGRGPQENYEDRNWGTDMGLYHSTASAEAYPYVRPQETGHHTDTRYLALTSRKVGLAVIADEAVGFNALRNSVEDFDGEGHPDKPYQWKYFSADGRHDEKEAFGYVRRQTHVNDIHPRPFVELCIDYRMAGLGGDDAWGAPIYDQYRIWAADDAQWGFTILPVRSAAEAARYNAYSF